MNATTTTKEIPLERVREHWARAAEYSPTKENVYPGHAEAQEFEKSAGKRVLEYGCGGGSDAMSYLRRAASVTFVDIVGSNVQATKERIKADPELVATIEGSRGVFANAMHLLESHIIPLPPNTFDLVSAHGVLHHIVEPLPVLAEFRRLLRPHGKLYVMLYTDLLERRFERKIAMLMDRRGLSRTEAFAWCTDEEGAPYARSYTRDQGQELLEAAGFKLVSTYDYAGGDFRTFRAEAL